MNPFIPRSLCVAVVFLHTAGFSKTYTTRFDGTENPLSEGGFWSHAGLDWKTVQKVDGVAFGTQTGTGGYDDSYTHLSGFGSDQAAWGVIQRKSGSRGVHEVEIHLRWSDSAHSAKGYECLLSYDGSYAQIVRWNGPFGDFTYIGWAASAPVPRTGDTLRAAVSGNLITVQYNGVEIMRATDDAYAAGDPGIGFYVESEGENSDMGFTSFSATDEGGTGTAGRTAGASTSCGLLQNFPNPFNPCTAIPYTLFFPCPVTLKVYDALGRETAELVNEIQSAGTHAVPFDGSGLASGTYTYRLNAGGFVRTRRMMLLK
jgi:hypothetical protein